MNKDQIRERISYTIKNRESLLKEVSDFMVNKHLTEENVYATSRYFSSNSVYNYNHLLYSIYYKQEITNDKVDLEYLIGNPLSFECFYLNTVAGIKLGEYSLYKREQFNLIDYIKPKLENNKVKKTDDPLYTKYNRYFYRCKDKNREFLVSKEEFARILTQNCSYCNSTPEETTMTIDRIDSKKGYIDGNMQACCNTCNTMKMHLPESLFKDQIVKVYNNLFK